METYSFTKASCTPAKIHHEVGAQLPGLVSVGFDADAGKVYFDFVEALTEGQQTTLGNIVTAHQAGSGIVLPYNYTVESVVAGKVTKRSYYTTKVGSVFSGLTREEAFNYSGNHLLSVTETVYFSDGVVSHTNTITFSTGSGGERIEHRN